MSYEIVNYALARNLDGKGYIPFIEPIPFLNRLLKLDGRTAADTIVALCGADVTPLFKWMEETKEWQSIN